MKIGKRINRKEENQNQWGVGVEPTPLTSSGCLPCHVLVVVMIRPQCFVITLHGAMPKSAALNLMKH